jgi:signal transduction histidine kinase
LSTTSSTIICTTPVYDGTTEGTGYLKFLACFPDLIGWPASIVTAVLLLATVFWCVQGQIDRREWILLASCMAVFDLYFLMIGKFPRMGTRFVLPSAPFVLLLAAPALARIDWKHWIAKAILLVVICYNFYASIDAGLRFANDPRMKALAWVRKNLPDGAMIENSYAPDWRKIAGKKYRVEQMPAATGRSQLFTKILGKQKTIQQGLDRFESNYGEFTFTREGLESRNPDFIAFTSQVFEWSGDDDAQRFYAALDRGEFGYKKLYEETARQRWPLSYPLRIDFIADRMVILGRKGFF